MNTARLLRDLGDPINAFAAVVCAVTLLAAVAYGLSRPKQLGLMFKNLRRNLVRTCLISLAIIVLVAMITLIWSVIHFLDNETREKSKDLKLIVTERWQLPSQMPFKHADYLDPSSAGFLDELKGKYTEKDFMTWSFFGCTLDPTKKNPTPNDVIFFFAMNPDHIRPMMEELDTLDPELVAKLKAVRNGCLVGKERLAKIGKVVGERFKGFSFNYKEIDLEFEIVGQLPEGRYNQSAIMNRDYFVGAFDQYERTKGKKHPLHGPDDRRLNLVWLRVPDRDTFNEVGAIIEKNPRFDIRPVRVDTASSLVASFLEAYSGLLQGVKYLLVPSILAIMSLVVAIAISISVRERRSEIAVMKVLGYKPNTVLALVLGESILLGTVSGLLAAGAAYAIINLVLNGLKFPIAFFPAFFVPQVALFWGPAMGSLCALVGSFFPAWNARSVRVSEVFAKVA